MSALAPGADSRQLQPKALKIIAKSLFKELRQNGYDCRQIASLSTELLELVASEIQQRNEISIQ